MNNSSNININSSRGTTAKEQGKAATVMTTTTTTSVSTIKQQK
jgi:hypothetical protein